MSTHGKFHWNELMTHDAEKAKKFYGDAVGWTFDGMSMEGTMYGSTYWIAKSGEEFVGGIFPMSGPMFENVPDHWMPYLAVDDIDARVKKAVAGGATVMREPFEVPGVGRIAILKEPGGAVVGWMTPPKG